jgi:hypothetical protein
MAIARLINSIKFYLELDDFLMISNVIEQFELKYCTTSDSSAYFTEEEYTEIFDTILAIDLGAICKLKEVIVNMIKQLRVKYLDKQFITDMLICERIVKNIDSNSSDIGVLSKLPSAALWNIRMQVYSWH